MNLLQQASLYTYLAFSFDGGLLNLLNTLLLFFHDLGLSFVLPQELGIATLGVL